MAHKLVCFQISDKMFEIRRDVCIRAKHINMIRELSNGKTEVVTCYRSEIPTNKTFSEIYKEWIKAIE